MSSPSIFGGELRKAIEPNLAGAPIVLFRPIAVDVLDPSQGAPWLQSSIRPASGQRVTHIAIREFQNEERRLARKSQRRAIPALIMGFGRVRTGRNGSCASCHAQHRLARAAWRRAFEVPENYANG